VPELPEVETVVRCLAPELTGRRVVGVSVHETRLRGGVAPDFAERLAGRRGHFMPASLLESQLATLEEPAPDEHAWVCDIRDPPDTIVADLVRRGA